MSQALKFLQGVGAEDKLYSDDVFSTYTYTGTGATQTITNGIDLAGKGGLVWIKDRNSGAKGHALFDTARGVNLKLQSQSINGQFSMANQLTAFYATGFALGSAGDPNGAGTTYVSWTFRKSPKFFDVVTYTGDGNASKVISHSLGIMPGMIIVKSTNTTGDWVTCSRYSDTNYSGGNAALIYALNTTGVPGAGVSPELRGITASNFDAAKLSGTNASYEIEKANSNGVSYVAYIFAHDTSAEGIIQSGPYTGNGSVAGPIVTLGWEPQYLLIKKVDGTETGNWQIIDSMRGMPVGTTGASLQANLSNAETAITYVSPMSTGFQVVSTSSQVNLSGATYIYLAIRRPNKPPTSGTQVLEIKSTTSLNEITSDMVGGDLAIARDVAVTASWMFCDRLRGLADPAAYYSKALYSNSTNAEATPSTGDTIHQLNNGKLYTAGAGFGSDKPTAYFFKRAPGVFDEVCYTGTSNPRTVSHGLGVVPELIIIKARGNGTAGPYGWPVYSSSTGNTTALFLNTTAAVSTLGYWYNTSPTSTLFTLATSNPVNDTTDFVAYLFATKAGISKVGSYTGNGSSQTINCGFTTGSRFILIKRTDSTGDWYVWDSTRGIIAGNDPHLSLNTTAAEVTTDDSVDPDASGFIVNQVAATNINVASASYIYLSLA